MARKRPVFFRELYSFLTKEGASFILFPLLLLGMPVLLAEPIARLEGESTLR